MKIHGLRFIEHKMSDYKVRILQMQVMTDKSGETKLVWIDVPLAEDEAAQ